MKPIILGCLQCYYILVLQTDPIARSLKNKSFPFYTEWVEIFGNDRANGNDAQAFVDVVQDVLSSKSTAPIGESTGFDFAGETPATDSPASADFTSFNPGESSSATKVKGKGVKRKQVDAMDDIFMETMSKFCDHTKSNMGNIADTMGNIAHRIGSKFDATQKRGQVYESLGLLGFLPVEGKVFVAQYLCNNSNELDLYFSLPDEAKAVMVKNIILKSGVGGS